MFRLAQLAFDCGNQSLEVSLDDVVMSAGPHGGDCDVLTHGARHENIGYIGVSGPDKPKRVGALEEGHRIIAKDDVPILVIERLMQRFRRIDAMGLEVVAGPLQLARQQGRVVFGIFNKKCFDAFLHLTPRFSEPVD